MASRDDHHPNPFGWVILGFICGVVATLGVLILLSDIPEPDAAERTAAVASASSVDKPKPTPVVAPAPAVESRAPIEAAAPAVAPPPVAVAPSPSSADDAQIAEDAAASGMTARAQRP